MAALTAQSFVSRLPVGSLFQVQDTMLTVVSVDPSGPGVLSATKGRIVATILATSDGGKVGHMVDATSTGGLVITATAVDDEG